MKSSIAWEYDFLNNFKVYWVFEFKVLISHFEFKITTLLLCIEKYEFAESCSFMSYRSLNEYMCAKSLNVNTFSSKSIHSFKQNEKKNGKKKPKTKQQPQYTKKDQHFIYFKCLSKSCFTNGYILTLNDFFDIIYKKYFLAALCVEECWGTTKRWKFVCGCSCWSNTYLYQSPKRRKNTLAEKCMLNKSSNVLNFQS